MTKYREILRLTALGLSQRNIVQSIGVSQKTVVKVQKRAREMHLSWPLGENLTDAALETLMFPKESKVSKQKRMPDFNYIQKELLRNGVNKKLLWTVPGGMPPVRRRAAHVFPVLLLHPAG